LGGSPHSRRAVDVGFRCLRANHLALDETITKRSECSSAVASIHFPDTICERPVLSAIALDSGEAHIHSAIARGFDEGQPGSDPSRLRRSLNPASPTTHPGRLGRHPPLNNSLPSQLAFFSQLLLFPSSKHLSVLSAHGNFEFAAS